MIKPLPLRIILFSCFLFASPVMGQVNLWTHITEEENEESEGNAIVETEPYKMLVGGAFRNQFSVDGYSISTNAIGKSYFLMEAGIEGEVFWLHHFAADNDFKVQGLAVDASSNIFILAELKGAVSYGATIMGDAFTDKETVLIKLNSSGGLLWHKFVRDPGNTKFKVKGFDVNNNGEIYLAAELKEYVTIEGQQFGPQGKQDILLLKYSSSGNLLHHHQLSSPFKVKPEALKLSKTGKVYISGEFDGKLNFSANTSISGGAKQSFIARLDQNFNLEWSFTKFSGPKGFKIKAINEDNDNNLLIAGEFEVLVEVDGQTVQSISQKKDVLLIKFSQQGNVLWMHNANPLNEAKPTGIKTDKNNNVYLYGEYKQGFRYGYENENPLVTTCEDAANAKGSFIAKYSPDGKVKAAKSVSGVNEAKIGELYLDFKNDIYVTGYFKNALALDTINEIQGTNKKSFFLAKIDLNSCVYKYDYSQDFINKDVVFLHQNFPNPTSGDTYIHFHTAKEVPVIIRIFDYLGREVDVVFNAPQTQVANYVFPYRFPDRCTSGIYMLVLESGDRRLTKKIVLSR